MAREHARRRREPGNNPRRGVALAPEVEAAIDACMIRDRHRFRREAEKGSERWRKLEPEVARSKALADRRRALLPKPVYPPALPVSGKADEIMGILRQHQVLILAGETGSGKTTQIPKICLGLGRGVFGRIGHTQPRRVAARNVSQRIAEELGVQFGKEVGYQVRFTDQSGPETLLKVMTDGVLLQETQSDRFLESYDTIIIDEAHERSLNIDFLLGYIKRILPKRPDLKLIVTSATIDVERFSRHFNDAPILEVSGRMFPVEVHYRPLEDTDRQRDADERVRNGILDAVAEIIQMERASGGLAKARRGQSDILVFLPGEREIRETAQDLRRAQLRDVEILPLYSRLSVAEQNRVFAPHTGRRIVLATNVAETSLTVPGIRYVIDPGLARISRYSVRSKVQRLPVEAISQASANQRMGRCGRVSEGVCFRLFAEEDFLSRDEFTEPEILRTNLAAVILQMLTLKLGEMAQFPFVEKPEQRQINDGFALLRELEAVSPAKQITRLGRDVARLPVDLRLARMLVQSHREGCVAEMLIIVSALAIIDPRERPHDFQAASDQSHRLHWHERSDFLSLVNLWRQYEDERAARSSGQLRKYCRDHFLNFLRMREWRDVHRELRLMAREMGMRENPEPADYPSVHRSILSGLLGNIGEKGGDNEYLGTRNRRHFIFPGSSQSSPKPRWIVAAELTETTRLFARTVAGIDPEWIEPLAGHLVSRTHHDPYYDVTLGQVMALEQVTLYGLVIVKRRAVSFAGVDAGQARAVFVQMALVEQAMRSDARFYVHNKQLVEAVERLESKTRRRDILVSPMAIFQFYDERLPQDVSSVQALDQWRNQAEKNDSGILCMTREDLMRNEVVLSEAQFPDEIEVRDMRLKLNYHFDPQHQDDGVSVSVPASVLHQVPKAQLDWLIPGLLRDKCVALIKSLPKNLRKNFVPAPDYVDRAIENMQYDGRVLKLTLGERLRQLTGVRIPEDAWGETSLDDHLAMNVKVLDKAGQIVGVGRDLNRLIGEFGSAGESTGSVAHPFERTGVTDWDFELPERVTFREAGVEINGYPTVQAEGDTVSLRVLDNKAKAARATMQGTLALIMRRLPDRVRYVRKNLPGFTRIALHYSTIGRESDLRDELTAAIFRYTFIDDKALVRTAADFAERLQARGELIDVMNRVTNIVAESVAGAHEIRRGLDQSTPAHQDVNEQLQRLLSPGFLNSLPFAWLRHVPRYIKAAANRVQKLDENPARDVAQMREVQEAQERIDGMTDQIDASAELLQYRWMLEEFRVSLFAQNLGTSLPVSGKRLRKQWQKYQSL
jgi:ATP-dependent helicase HrpA